ncbi:MAG: hypothetical protein QOH89_2895, partial [Pseudonocardiales bacterium]|nr:hypothetical protein [Pseudonocardiales bacterium]
YDVPVEVLHVGNRILVAGAPDEHVHEHDHVAAAVEP